MPRGKFDPAKLEKAGSIELAPALAVYIDEKIKQSEEDISRSRVSFMWQRAQVDMINRIAELMGLTPAEYMKIVLVRQAARDMAELQQSHQGTARVDATLKAIEP